MVFSQKLIVLHHWGRNFIVILLTVHERWRLHFASENSSHVDLFSFSLCWGVASWSSSNFLIWTWWAVFFQTFDIEPVSISRPFSLCSSLLLLLFCSSKTFCFPIPTDKFLISKSDAFHLVSPILYSVLKAFSNYQGGQ